MKLSRNDQVTVFERNAMWHGEDTVTGLDRVAYTDEPGKGRMFFVAREDVYPIAPELPDDNHCVLFMEWGSSATEVAVSLDGGWNWTLARQGTKVDRRRLAEMITSTKADWVRLLPPGETP